VNRNRRRSVPVAVAAAVLIGCAVVLSGCAAGLGANTATAYNPTLGTDAVVGDMHVDNIVVVDDGNVPELYATLINQSSSSDTLMSLEVSSAQTVVLGSGGVDVPPAGFVTFGQTSTHRALIDGMQAKLGDVVKVTMLFRVAGSVSVSALVTTPSNLIAGS
jgi:copper(I)-binding protein